MRGYLASVVRVLPGSGASTVSCSVVTAALFRGKGSRNAKVTPYLHLVPRFRMGGAMALLPLCVFIALGFPVKKLNFGRMKAATKIRMKKDISRRD